MSRESQVIARRAAHSCLRHLLAVCHLSCSCCDGRARTDKGSNRGSGGKVSESLHHLDLVASLGAATRV